jgi:hypothetical protein
MFNTRKRIMTMTGEQLKCWPSSLQESWHTLDDLGEAGTTYYV